MQSTSPPRSRISLPAAVTQRTPKLLYTYCNNPKLLYTYCNNPKLLYTYCNTPKLLYTCCNTPKLFYTSCNGTADARKGWSRWDYVHLNLIIVFDCIPLNIMQQFNCIKQTVRGMRSAAPQPPPTLSHPSPPASCIA